MNAGRRVLDPHRPASGHPHKLAGAARAAASAGSWRGAAEQGRWRGHRHFQEGLWEVEGAPPLGDRIHAGRDGAMPPRVGEGAGPRAADHGRRGAAAAATSDGVLCCLLCWLRGIGDEDIDGNWREALELAPPERRTRRRSRSPPLGGPPGRPYCNTSGVTGLLLASRLRS